MCKHYWIIEEKDRSMPIAVGICRECGENREFQNRIELSKSQRIHAIFTIKDPEREESAQLFDIVHSVRNHTPFKGKISPAY